MKFKLVRVADGAEIPVTATLLVGRLEECGLRLTQGLPSRRHAQLTVIEQKVWVEDLGSVNGTFINGKRIAAKSVLSPGDKVRFDVEEFHLHAAPDSQSAPTMYRPLAQEVASMQAAKPVEPKVIEPKVMKTEPIAPLSPSPRPPPSPPLSPSPSAAPSAAPSATPSAAASGLHRKLELSPEPRASEPKDVKPPASSEAKENPPAAEVIVERRKAPETSSKSEPPAKGSEAGAEGSGLFKRPGAWADPDFDDGAHKTKFMDPAALKGALAQRGAAPAAPVAVTTPCLVLLSGSARGSKVDLQPGVSEWTIGSGPECQVKLADTGVSSLHAKLVNDGKRWKLIDQMSANGTYVNGKRSNVSYLSPGDRLGFGPVECELRLPQGSAVSHAADHSGGGNKRTLYVAAAIAGVLIIAAAVWLLL